MSKWITHVFLIVSVLSTTVAMAAARTLAQPYHVSGKVYCDTCRCGFETSVTTYIPGATVELQCMDRSDSRLVYRARTKTNRNGAFEFTVNHSNDGGEYCEVVLVASPWSHCKSPDPGRSRSRVIVTNYNYNFNTRFSSQRFASALGFLQDRPLLVCPDLLKDYLQSYIDE